MFVSKHENKADVVQVRCRFHYICGQGVGSSCGQLAGSSSLGSLLCWAAENLCWLFSHDGLRIAFGSRIKAGTWCLFCLFNPWLVAGVTLTTCDCCAMTHDRDDEPRIPVTITTLWSAPPPSRNTTLYVVSMSKISPSFVGFALALAVAQSCSCTSALVLPDTATASIGHPTSPTRASFLSTPFLPRLHKRTLAMTQADSGTTSPVQAAPSGGDGTAGGESVQHVQQQYQV